jgi:hypothetical protein
MAKEYFFIFDPCPNGKFRIAGIAAVSEDSGCTQRIFNTEEALSFTKAFSNICNQRSNRRGEYVDALISEFL